MYFIEFFRMFSSIRLFTFRGVIFFILFLSFYFLLFRLITYRRWRFFSRILFFISIRLFIFRSIIFFISFYILLFSSIAYLSFRFFSILFFVSSCLLIFRSVIFFSLIISFSILIVSNSITYRRWRFLSSILVILSNW